MIVYKFGGTSLEDAGRIRNAAGLVAGAGEPCVSVVSAMSGVTDGLMELAAFAREGQRRELARAVDRLHDRHRAAARQLLGDTSEGGRVEERIAAIVRRLRSLCEDALAAGAVTRRFMDEVSATGEDLSAELLAGALEQEAMRARVVDARTVVRTNGSFGAAIPRDEETARLVKEVLAPLVEEGAAPVLQGFVGSTEEGVTTTLGRGGSDFTAAIVGAALGAREVTIWTDVDGVHSADPRLVQDPRILPELGYEEAVELAYFGAKVIHPAAAKHAAARDVSLRIRNTLRPEAPGTLVLHDRARATGVAAIAYKPGVVLIDVRSRPMFMAYGFLARVFDVLARHRTPVDLVATSHTSTAFTIEEQQDLDAVREELGEFAEVEMRSGLATLTVIGHGLLREPGISARVFSELADTPVQLISQASDVSLSFLVASGIGPEVVRRLHSKLIEGKGGTG